MSDHLHLLLEGTAPDADLRDAVSRWKQRTGYDWSRRHGSQLGQPGFYDHVLRESDDTRAVVAYIIQNPVRAGLVISPFDYRFVGSSIWSLGELLNDRR